jgi:hypothetical protein
MLVGYHMFVPCHGNENIPFFHGSRRVPICGKTLLKRIRYRDEPLGVVLEETVYAFGATIIDLSLSVFPRTWASLDMSPTTSPPERVFAVINWVVCDGCPVAESTRITSNTSESKPFTAPPLTPLKLKSGLPPAFTFRLQSSKNSTTCLKVYTVCCR